jgi:hypothetical protein
VLNVGFNYQRSRTEWSQDFDTQDNRETGIPIYDNTVVFLDNGQRQFVTRRAFLDTEVDSYNFFASVGVNDRVDVAVAVPLLSLRVTGTTNESYDISRTFGAPTTRGAEERARRGVPIGIWVPFAPRPSQQARGIGDITVRGKFALTPQQSSQGMALSADVTLPTGDEEELLGRGEATASFAFLAAKTLASRASAYGNAGYRFGKQNNEAHYIAGVDVSVLPRDRLTVAVSFLGRALRNASSLARVPTVRRETANLGNTEPSAPNPERSSVEIDRFFWSRDTAVLNRLSTEFKVHLKGQWLATGAILFALNQRGLQPKPVPFVGLEWAGGQ